MLATVAEHVRSQAAELCASGLPGYLAGVYHDGEQVVVAQGTANVQAGIEMTEDTGFLLGSITKVLTTTLVLRQFERGQVDLDERVVTYLPDFALASPAQVDEIRVRNLLTHTDGIDADLFFPDVDGPESLRIYLELLRRCGTLFEPGEYISYSNPAFMVAGRLLEVVSGTLFNELLERELFAPCGMANSCTSAKQAILRRTAVGHFVDPATGTVRPTEMFMLPDSWSSAGSTAIVTIGDLLDFARAHLADGLAPSGQRVLSEELARRMRTTTHDMDTPNVPPIGLGWWLMPYGETTVLWHGGGSPGGGSCLFVVPEHDLAFAAFGNSGVAGALHDRLLLWLLREHLGLDVPDGVPTPVDGGDLGQYEGSYQSHQLRWDVRAVDGELEETATLEPVDETQARLNNLFAGGYWPPPPRRLVPVGESLFAPASAMGGSLAGLGRTMLASFHGWTDGRPTYRSSGARLPRRAGSA